MNKQTPALMKSNVILRCTIATRYHGSKVSEDIDLGYTHEEWATFSEEERAKECQSAYEDFLINETDSSWKVLDREEA